MFGKTFSNFKKTKLSFLREIEQISKDNDALRSNLMNLDIFSNVLINKNKVTLTEKPNEVRATCNNIRNKQLFINLPNVFGKAEHFNFMCEIGENKENHKIINEEDNKKDYYVKSIRAILNKFNINSFLMEISKPHITNFGVFKHNSYIAKTKLCVKQKETELNKILFNTKSVLFGVEKLSSNSNAKSSLMFGIEKINENVFRIIEGGFRLPGIDFSFKSGNCSNKIKNSSSDESLLEQNMIKNYDKTENTPNKKYTEIAKDMFENQIKENLMFYIKKLNLNNSFLKINAKKNIRKECNRFYINLMLEAGKILDIGAFCQSKITDNNTPKLSYLDRYFASIRGYKSNAITPINANKKQGGTTFFKMSFEGGMKIFKKIKAFAFFDAAACTNKPFIQTLKQLDDKESTSIGKSIGIGIKIQDTVSFIYAVPLTKSIETEKYQFGMDMKF
ncbi:hypothetical protein EHP00_484 [Ecytonucleospora hepatopenaei]|uniref:Bacterial surface antigen (D15) domain-containing protein n=1 Tax=Ecytonucleospora hepatopenaei TaxID=646526 RepID=A0A1W0E935_9MICR|nr:hypothetical protein EHP00_484 [Ecytonucleospora hepatopenaei]